MISQNFSKLELNFAIFPCLTLPWSSKKVRHDCSVIMEQSKFYLLTFYWLCTRDQGLIMPNLAFIKFKHWVKSILIWSFPGPCFPAVGLNMDQKSSRYGHFLGSDCLWVIADWPKRCLTLSQVTLNQTEESFSNH